jgi:hypothetical protein
VKEMNALMEEFVPGIAFPVFQLCFTVSVPLFKKDSRAVLLGEIGRHGSLEAAAEGHGGSCVLFAPPVEIAVPTAARATQILALADLN